MGGSNRVVCVGVVTVDTLVLLDRYPGSDERIEARELEISGGGPAANAAVVLARQGVPVSFVGRVGNDETGRQALRMLTDEGVDVSAVTVQDNSATQASVILIDQPAKTRAICTLKVRAWTELSDAAKELIDGAAWVHTDHLGFAPVADYLRGRDQRPVISLDAGNEVAGLDLSMIDVFVPTASALRARYGVDDTSTAAKKAMEEGAASVVATSGSVGAEAWWSQSAASIGGASSAGKAMRPAYDVEPIMSTLGAGDVFHGALVSALVRGRTWDQSLADSNVTAGLSCRALDGRRGVPDLTELEHSLPEYYAQEANGETR